MGGDGTVRAIGQGMAAVDEGDVDVVTVCRFLALQALERLPAPGAVTVDPFPAAPSLSFLVPSGAAAGWRLPHTTACGSSVRVALPPDDKEAPPGPYWLIGRSQGLTSAAALLVALEAVVRRWPVGEPASAAVVRELWLPSRVRAARPGRERDGVPRDGGR
ncbi:hypothetical protein [Streptomyces cavernae]|uniref:hypothetical protein n=1 Tax=Streptomyces cavernae TaxID=2259034 RepID=UPI000FEB7193|nr:hypothetical protein [Streptomyces cavernae]